MKDLFLKIHESLTDAYMETRPGIPWDTAYQATADMAYELYQEIGADMVDNARERAKG